MLISSKGWLVRTPPPHTVQQAFAVGVEVAPVADLHLRMQPQSLRVIDCRIERDCLIQIKRSLGIFPL